MISTTPKNTILLGLDILNYSSFDFVESDLLESDIDYVGYDKGGREQTVLDVYQKIMSGGTVRFDVVSCNPADTVSSLTYLRSKISYPQVISRVKSTNCIFRNHSKQPTCPIIKIL